MRLLLDTHVLIWQLLDDPRLRPRWRNIMVAPETEIFLSDVSLWEIVLKTRTGRLEFDLSVAEKEVSEFGYHSLPLRRAHLHALTAMPIHHRDPFDHLLLAQASVEGLTLLTNDRAMTRYGVPTLS